MTPGLDDAVRLFNAAQYHDAHEVLDELWEATHDEDSDFYKGLIQACIAMHHYSRDNFDGAKKLYRGHRRYLAPYLPAHAGLDVERFLTDMQRVLQPVVRSRESDAPRFDRETRPQLCAAASGDGDA